MELKERLNRLFESGDLTSYLKEDTDYKSMCSKIGSELSDKLFQGLKLKSTKGDGGRHAWEMFRFVPEEAYDPFDLQADTIKAFIDNLGKEYEISVGTAKAPKTLVVKIESLSGVTQSDKSKLDNPETVSSVVNSFYSEKRADVRCSSDSYKSAEFVVSWYNKDDPEEKDEHKYYACVASSKKKAYTPNAALKKLTFSLTEVGSPEKLIKISDTTLKTAMISLMNAANSSNYTNDIMTKLGKAHSYLSCEKGSTCPEKLYIEYQSDVVKDALKTLRPADVNAMSVDFAEVFGAIAVARALANALGESDNTTYIEFPSASNEPIIDYYVILKKKGVKFSAKTGAGGSPSSTGLINSIYEKIFGKEEHKDPILTQYYNEHKVAKSFFDKLLVKDIRDAKSMQDSYLQLAEETISLMKGDVSEEWQKSISVTLDNVIAKLDKDETQDIKGAIVRDWETIKELAEHGDAKNIEQQEELASNLYDRLMDIKRGLKIKTSTGKPKDVPDKNPKAYWKNNAISTLVKILVALINSTPEVIDSFNEMFNLSFGRFCQIYFDNKELNAGKFKYRLVFTGADGKEINAGQTVERYEFVQNCGQSGSDGAFKNQYLAVVMAGVEVKSPEGTF